MADEAILRVIVEGAGGAGGGGTGGGGGGGGVPAGSASGNSAAAGFVGPPNPFQFASDSAAKFAAEMGRLQESLGIVDQLAAQEVALAAARKAVTDELAAETERLTGLYPMAEAVPEALRVADEELKEFAIEMGRLNAAMDPALVKQRVEQELELQSARQRLGHAMEAERERQAPTAEGVGGGGILDQIRGALGSLRGVPGGRAAGAGLDLAGALKGGGGVAAGLGVAGAVVAVTEAVMAALRALRDRINDSIDAVGRFAAGMASADESVSSSINTFAASINGVSDAVFNYVPTLGILGSAAGHAAGALGEFSKALDGTVDRYAAYSGPLAAAQAQSEVTQVLNDIRRSQEVTPNLVQYIRARTELQQKYEDLKIRFINRVMPVTIRGLEMLEGLADRADILIAKSEAMRDTIREHLPEWALKLIDKYFGPGAQKPSDDDKAWELPTDFFLGKGPWPNTPEGGSFQPRV